MNWTYYSPTFEYEKSQKVYDQPWAGHIYFVYDLIRNLKPKRITELGTYIGVSFFAMCQAVKDGGLETELHPVDTWKGDTQTRFYDQSVYKQFTNLKKLYYRNLKITTHRKLFDDALKDFKPGSIDLLHIDGLHTYEAVKQDFESWLKKVKKDAVIMFHDTNVKKGDFGVYKLWAEIKKKYRTVEFLHSHGLGVIFLSKKQYDNISVFKDIWPKYYAQKASLITLGNEANLLRTENNQLHVDLLRKDDRLMQLEPAYEQFQGLQNGYFWKFVLLARSIKSKTKKALLLVRYIIKRPHKIFEGIKVLITTGPQGILEKTRIPQKQLRYDSLFKEQYQKKLRRELLKKDTEEFPLLAYRPKISILLPVYNTGRKWLVSSIESVIAQKYDNWELCIADDASTKSYIKPILEEYAQKDLRIKVTYRKKNGHICKSTNSCLKMATGDYVTLLDHDDELSSDALYEVARVLNKYPETDFIYSDEDKYELSGKRSEPGFKPGWSVDKLCSFMYVGHLSVYRKSILDKVRGFRPGMEGAQDYDLLLRSYSHFKSIYHIEKILYHWRKIESSTARSLNAKPYWIAAAEKTLTENLKEKIKSDFSISYSGAGYFFVHAKLKGGQKIDLYVTNGAGEFVSTVSNVLGESVGKVNVFENAADLNNRLSTAQSEFSLICTSPSAKIENPEELLHFVGYLNVEGVGIIGPKLVDPAGKITSAGLILTESQLSTPFAGFKKNFTGYGNNLVAPVNYSGLDSSFFMINNKIFARTARVFDLNLPKLFALDASLKMWKKDARTVLLPMLRVMIPEPIDYTVSAIASEYAMVKQKHKHAFFPDRFYNSNFSQSGDLYIPAG